jgi:acyl carrier protein
MSTIASTPQAVSNIVRSFLFESFLSDRDEDQLGADDELIAVLDSLQLLRMVIHLEETFGIAVDYSELTLENLGTLRRIGTFVDRKLNS